MANVADFVDMNDNTYTSLLERIRGNREFPPYIAQSLARLLSREEDFVRGSLSGAVVDPPLQEKGSSDLHAQIILGIYCMSNGEYEEAQRHFFEAKDMSRNKGVTSALITVGSNILPASTIYNMALSHVKSQLGHKKK